MSGYEIFNKAVLRLGYNNSVKDSLVLRAKELINQIALDLNIETIDSLTDVITADTNILEAVCCGLAMLLALSESDGEKHKIFCEIYNAKRGAVLSKTCFVEDRLPKTESGEG